MATTTTNFALKKPAYTDTADVGDFNENMDTVDEHLAEVVYYGTCSTAASTQQKSVTATNFPAALSAGVKLRVKFTNGQTYNGQPTLKVGSLAAKNICRYGSTAAARYEWQAGEVVDFIYDGTNWIIVGGGIATTTYFGRTKLTNSTTSTSETMAVTAKALSETNEIVSTPTVSETTAKTGDRNITTYTPDDSSYYLIIAQFECLSSSNTVAACSIIRKNSSDETLDLRTVRFNLTNGGGATCVVAWAFHEGDKAVFAVNTSASLKMRVIYQVIRLK